MSQWSGEAFRLTGPLFVLAWLLAWLLFTPLRRRMRRRRIVPDEPAGTPYRVFAADSDADIPAHEAVRFVLDRNRDQPDGAAATIGSWQARIEERDRIFRELGPHWDRDCGQLWPEFEAALAGTSVLVLCDQSGSMRDRIIGYGAGLRWLYAQLADHGVSTMIAGFTTSEWQGGRPVVRGSNRESQRGRADSVLCCIYDTPNSNGSRLTRIGTR